MKMLILPLTIVAMTMAKPVVQVSGDWAVKVPAQSVRVGANTVQIANAINFRIDPPTVVAVNNEKHAALPEFSPTGIWTCGDMCYQVISYGISVPGIVKAGSVQVKAGPYGKAFEPEKDYKLDPLWGSVGRLSGGAIGPDTPVWFDYTYGMSRIDTIAINEQGVARLIKGKDSIFCAQVPSVPKNEKRLANIWVPGYVTKLNPDLIYQIRENGPYHDKSDAQAIHKLIPKTWHKLVTGQPVRILAWGDSVTDGAYIPNESQKWQGQFYARLKKEFPSAKIELITEAWGGRTTVAYLAEPAGSPKNFKEHVLDADPDLVISEFVNDVGLSVEDKLKSHNTIRDAFRQKGIEWIILTPHYDTWQYLGNFAARVEKDTRPHSDWLRSYAKQNNIALVDASVRWDHLAARGIPYTIYLTNCINHPDPEGLGLYADALMDAFSK